MRTCRIYQCDKAATFSVFYQNRVKTLLTRNRTVVCNFHLTDDTFPWGTIVARKKL